MRLAAIAAAFSVAACVGSAQRGPTNEISGDVSGNAVSAENATASVGSGSDSSTGTTYYSASMSLAMSAEFDACDGAQNGYVKASSSVLDVVVARSGLAAQSPIEAATYKVSRQAQPVGSALLVVTAMFSKLDASCADTMSGDEGIATGGTFTISGISSSTASGTFDITFPNGHVTGSFEEIPLCSVEISASTSPPSCRP